jgi:hypothetical protein
MTSVYQMRFFLNSFPENVVSSREIIEVVVEEVVWVGWQCLHATLDRR